MNEIGLEFKDKRTEGGLSISEVAEDLNVDVSDIECLENGVKDHFSNIYSLKDLISSYAKYLGLDESKLSDQFNEYMFSQTSRISLEDIEKAKEMIEEKRDDVVSPYTKATKNKKKIIVCFVIALVFLLIIFFVSYFVVNNYFTTKEISGNVSYVIGED